MTTPHAPTPITELIDVSTAAVRLHVSRRFVWSLMARGRLTPVRLGSRTTRIAARELEEFIARSTARASR